MGASESTYENSSNYNVKNSNVQAAAPSPPKITPRIIEFHSSARWKAHFEASKGTTKLTMVIDFTATWCGRRRQMEPMMNDLAANYTDVEFIKNGKVVDKVVVAKKDKFRKKVELCHF